MNPLNLDTKFHFHDAGLMTVERTQDCTPIAEASKLAQIEGRHGSSEMKHAASIPFVMIEKYCNDQHILFSEFMQNKDHMKRVLNDPALAYFRIWPGRV